MNKNLFLIPSFLFSFFMAQNATAQKCKSKFTYFTKDTTNEYTFSGTGLTGGSANSTLYWDFGDGKTSTTSTYIIKHRFNTKGTFKVCMIRDTAGCKDTVCQSLVANKSNPCNAKFTAFEDKSNYLKWNFAPNDTMEESYYWNRGAIGKPDTKYFSKTYTTNGTYMVSLLVENSKDHCRDSVNKYILVRQCGAGFSSSVNHGTKTATFTNSSTPNTTNYKWMFGDGKTATTKNPSHTYTSSGTYWVTLIAIDSITRCDDSVGTYITILGCDAKFNAYASDTTIYYNIQNPAKFKVKIDFGKGITASKDSGHVKVPPGTYNICVTIYCSSKDSSKSCTTIVASNKCKTRFIEQTNHITKTVVFTNTSTSNMNKFNWDFGDGTASSLKNPTHVYSKAGKYWVTLYAKDTILKCDDSLRMSITVNGCISNFTLFHKTSDTTLLCYTSNITKLKVRWDFGNGHSSNKDSVLYTYPKTGTYNVCLTVFCSSTDSSKMCSTIVVGKQCKAKFTKSLDTTQKFKIILINNSSNTSSTTYAWDFGDGGTSTTRNPSHKYSTFGVYYVCLTVKDGSCSSTYCDSLGMDSSGRLLKADGFGLEVIEGTGRIKKQVGSDFKLYPNPANNIISIELNDLSYDKLEIISVTGQVCVSQSLNNSNEKIDVNVESLRRGLYLIKLSNNNTYSYAKMIKN